MWTSLSVSRWIFLLTLTAVMLFSASGVDSHIHLKCCKPVRTRKINPIKHCYKQTPRRHCMHDAYKITDQNGQLYCVKPTPPWLQKRLKQGLNCSPDISPNVRKRFGFGSWKKMNWNSKNDAAWQLLGHFLQP